MAGIISSSVDLARIFHESLAATTDMAVLLSEFAALRSVPQAGSQLRGLATAIHEVFGPAVSRDIPMLLGPIVFP